MPEPPSFSRRTRRDDDEEAVLPGPHLSRPATPRTRRPSRPLRRRSPAEHGRTSNEADVASRRSGLRLAAFRSALAGAPAEGRDRISSSNRLSDWGHLRWLAHTGAREDKCLQIGTFETISKNRYPSLGGSRVRIPPPPPLAENRWFSGFWRLRHSGHAWGDGSGCGNHDRSVRTRFALSVQEHQIVMSVPVVRDGEIRDLATLAMSPNQAHCLARRRRL